MRDPSIVNSSAVLVTKGPFEGRILYSDDDGAMTLSEIREHCEYDEDISDSDVATEFSDGEYFPVSYCYFLYPFYKHNTVVIPHAWLKVPSLGELFRRSREVHQELADYSPHESHSDAIDYAEVSEERSLILSAIYEIESNNRKGKILGKRIFLCHASEDKGQVRQIHQDLSTRGHVPWIDEAEIKVGQSIVETIDRAIGQFDVFILFVSGASIEKPWVKKEWGAGLMRRLSDANVLFIPALIEPVEMPPLLSDLRYADFAEGYADALDSVLDSIDSHFIAIEHHSLR